MEQFKKSLIYPLQSIVNPDSKFLIPFKLFSSYFTA
jgi:hypothetical protein